MLSWKFKFGHAPPVIFASLDLTCLQGVFWRRNLSAIWLCVAELVYFLMFRRNFVHNLGLPTKCRKTNRLTWCHIRKTLSHQPDRYGNHKLRRILPLLCSCDVMYLICNILNSNGETGIKISNSTYYKITFVKLYLNNKRSIRIT
jgi:hypothetical protein